MHVLVKALFWGMLVALMPSALALPKPLQQQPELRAKEDITDQVNTVLEGVLASTADPDNRGERVFIVDIPQMAEIYLLAEDFTVAGISTFEASDCFRDKDTGELWLSFTAPQLMLSSQHYFINGTMVDHIEMEGEGPMSITVDQMQINLYGKGEADLISLKPFIKFDEVTLDLEMYRWTVNFENLLPGSDLGTVFNEFFTMYGPALFDMWEIRINESGSLLDWANCILPSPDLEASCGGK